MEDWISAFSGPRLDWTVLQAFRHVAQAGSFRSGSAAAGVSINTLRERVAHAERIAARPLLTRSVAGTVVTADGLILLGLVDAMAAILADDAGHSARLGGD
jgi:DNA-binding transcriptional LysR family regulator